MTSPLEQPRVHREVRSFVRRSTRMNATQQHAWAAHKQHWVVDVAEGATTTRVAAQPPLEIEALYGRRAPLVVEIGSGVGDSLVPMAASQPDRDFLAFEVFAPAVASTLSRINRAGVSNVRLVLCDAAQGISTLLGEGWVTEFLVFFPDPWHKARHHKRRLISPAFGELISSRLEPGGLLRLATDWQDYADAMREALDQVAALENVHEGWAPRFEGRPVTKYESRGLAAGRKIHDLTYRRVT